MKIDLSDSSLRLPAGAALRLSDACGVRVLGLEGRVWLTEEGSPDDVFLCSGDAHLIGRNGRVLIQADQDAALALEAAGGCALSAAWLRQASGRWPRAALPSWRGRFAAA